MLGRLMSDRTLRASKDTPVAFICHSLGGLIVKKLVLVANSDREQEPRKGEFLDRIFGVVFLDTPHGGSMTATIASQFPWLSSKSLRNLKANDAQLLDLATSYRNFIGGRARIRHRVFYAELGVAGATPVGATSGDPGLLGARPIKAANKDHFTICKPETRSDQVYESILEFLENDVLAPRQPQSPIQAYFIPRHTKSFEEFRAIILSHEAWSGLDKVSGIEENDARRVLNSFISDSKTGAKRYIIFIDLVESESNGDTEDVIKLIREVRVLGRDLSFKPIFVFFSHDHELISVFESLRPPEIGTALKTYLRLEPSEAGATMRERLQVLHREVVTEWMHHPKEEGPNPL